MPKRCIELPEYLDKWLEEFARDTARSPDDFIAEILHRYYDAWKIGRDSVRRTLHTGWMKLLMSI